MKTLLWCVETLFVFIRITVQHTFTKARYNLAQQQQARLRNRLQSKSQKVSRL